MTAHILVVDDDPHIREIVCFALASAGMQTSSANDGASALDRALRDKPDLIVLDVGLPEIDGLEVCKRIRRVNDQPILFLSSRSEEIDRILGIELGGDDYMVKPFSPRELVARVSAILRRSRAAPTRPDGVIEQGALRIDALRHQVSYNGQPIQLTSIELAILKALATDPGFVVDRKGIVAAAYPHNIHVSNRTIDSHIRNIRGKFATVGRPDIIETVHGVGFRFVFPEP